MSTAPATPVDLALSELSTALDEVVKAVEDAGLDQYDDHQLLSFFQTFEQVRNRMALVDHRALNDADRRGLPGRFTHQTLAGLLQHTLLLSPAEATRRVRAAEAFGEGMSMTGQPLPPRWPMLAALQRSGSLSPEQASIAERLLTKINIPGIDPVAVHQAEELLAGYAPAFAPPELRRIARHLEDAVDPDGKAPDDKLQRERRGLELSQLRDGSWRLEGRLTAALGARLSAILDPLAAPRQTTVPGTDGTPESCPDGRSRARRMHDALDEACGRLLRAGGLPASGGTPATIIINVDFDSLLDRTGYGHTSKGSPISVEELLRLADEAEVLPTVMTKSGVPLSLGRTRRIASAFQTYALIARDQGCSFPGCTHPPEWCDRHHVISWLNGGATDLSNLTLLCRYHHTHFLDHGWTCRIVNGLPEWIPPRWLDRLQRPLINKRIQAGQSRRRIEERMATASVAEPKKVGVG